MKNLSKKIDEELQVYLPDDYFEDLRAKLIPRLVRLFESEQSHIQVVMQAEGADSAKGAAVASEGQGEANMSADAGCPRCKSSDLLDTDDHWTHCQNCGFSFVG